MSTRDLQLSSRESIDLNRMESNSGMNDVEEFSKDINIFIPYPAHAFRPWDAHDLSQIADIEDVHPELIPEGVNKTNFLFWDLCWN